MKARFVAAFLAIVALSGCATSNAARRHSLDHYLPGVREMLQGFADSESKSEVDYFFVSPISHQESRDFAYAYWMTGNSIIILDLPVGKMDDPLGYSWYARKARVDLAKDIVPTKDDIGGSTYLVDAPWVEAIIRDALSSGAKIVVQKKEANKALEPTPTSVTPPAGAGVAPAVVVAHL